MFDIHDGVRVRPRCTLCCHRTVRFWILLEVDLYGGLGLLLKDESEMQSSAAKLGLEICISAAASV